MASLALSPRRLTTDEANAIATAPRDEIARAREYLELAFEPVPREGPDRVGWNAAIDKRLCDLAAKIAPGMSPDQSAPWRASTSMALSDLPAMIALTAAKHAIHRPMRFLNEVEGIVREIAAAVVNERRAAINRLAAPPVALLESSAAREVAPLSAEEIRRTPPRIRDMGLRQGWLTQDEVDAALSEDREAA